ncbi:hypothetical protein DRQ53_09900 [bacterium]|nr:MAG: hypothetical protein DRQ53_09900 [bacterium]
MGLIRVLVDRPVLSTMIVLAMVVLGLNGYVKLNLELIPRIDFPVIMVTTIYPGASSAEVESQVTKKIEDAVATLANIEELKSQSREGYSIITIEFDLKTSQDQDAIDVKDKVDAIRGDLPDNAEDPVVAKFALGGGAVARIAVSAPRTMAELYRVADERIREKLSQIDGVADVIITGRREREIRVTVAPERLRAYGLTLGELRRILVSGNLNIPAGNIARGGGEIAVRMKGEITAVSDLESFRVPLPGGGTIPLSEIADVLDTTEELREFTTLDGREVIGIDVMKRTDGNTVNVVDGVEQALARLRIELGSDYNLEVVSEGRSFVQASVDDVIKNIGIGILLTGLLLFIFLHDWRQTLIAALAMPVSVIATFMLMEQFGFTLNVMTLMALGISVGTLVTNSIVVLESIGRRIDLGENPHEAAIIGTQEVAVAVFASTLTNIVVFTPIAFMSGIIGRFFLQFGLTVVFSTVFSLVVSFSLVPMLAARALKPGKGLGHGESLPARLAKGWDARYRELEGEYRNALRHALHHRWLTLGLVSLILVGSMSLLGSVGGEFIPMTDQSKVLIQVQLPEGTSLQRSREVSTRIVDILKRAPEVSAVQISAGGSQRGIEDLDIHVRLVSPADRDASLFGFISKIRPELAVIPDAKINVFPAGEARAPEAEVILEVLGDRPETQEMAANMVLELMRGIPDLVDVTSSQEKGKPLIDIVPRRLQLAAHGLTSAQVGLDLRTAYEGTDAGVYREEGEEFDVVLRYPAASRQDPAELADLPIATSGGYTVPLADLVDLVQGVSAPTIHRADKQRKIEVTANIGAASLSGVRKLIDAGLAEADIPDDVVIKYGGSAENQDEAFASILGALILAIILIYIVLAGVLESFIHPLTVMITLPLGLTGLSVALFFTGETINIFSLMATVMLIGIVVNNAILLLDYTAQLRARGLSLEAALLEACPTRLRPIIMANVAIALGMMPQAMGGAGSEFRTPMAVVQIGGVIISAAFTLFVIPVVYSLFDRFELSGRNARRTT